MVNWPIARPTVPPPVTMRLAAFHTAGGSPEMSWSTTVDRASTCAKPTSPKRFSTSRRRSASSAASQLGASTAGPNTSSHR